MEVVQSCIQAAAAGDVEAPAGEAPTGEAPTDDGAAAYGGDNVNNQLCQNIVGDINVQGGDNVAASQYGDIAQENNTSVTVVQNCLQLAAAGDVEVPAGDAPEAPAPGGDDDHYVPPEGGGAAPTAPAEGGGAVAGGSASAPTAEGGAVTVLPDTGGASLFTLGAGALLVAGGLLARRIIR